MYKNLNCELLGISGRQSELLELALTYGFKGIDIDISDLVKRCERGSFETAARFLTSSKLRVGGFQTPIDLDGDEERFATEVAAMKAVGEVAGRAEARIAIVSVPCDTDRLPYPEYFEVVRQRITQIAEILASEEVRLALTFSTQKEQPEAEDKQFKFVQDVEGFVALLGSCPKAGFVFDSWNWFCGGGTEAHLEQIGVDRVLAVRISDCVQEVSPDAATHSDRLLPASTGVIDNVTYLRKFAEAGLDLPVSAVGRLPEPGGTRDAFVGKTQDALDTSLAEADIPSQTRKPEMFASTGYSRKSDS